MRINVTKAVLLTVAGLALVFLPRRSGKKDDNSNLSNQDISVDNQILESSSNEEVGNKNPS